MRKANWPSASGGERDVPACLQKNWLTRIAWHSQSVEPEPGGQRSLLRCRRPISTLTQGPGSGHGHFTSRFGFSMDGGPTSGAPSISQGAPTP